VSGVISASGSCFSRRSQLSSAVINAMSAQEKRGEAHQPPEQFISITRLKEQQILQKEPFFKNRRK